MPETNVYWTLTQTAMSEPENPSVLWAKFSKSLSVKLWGVSPRWTWLNKKPVEDIKQILSSKRINYYGSTKTTVP